MGDVYAAAYYHLAWATKNRSPLLVPEAELLVWDKQRRECEEMNARVYAVNGMPDHVHLVCAIPPALSVSQFVKGLKGPSSRFINQMEEPPTQGLCLYWQRGYGVHTFARRDMPRIVSYVQDQKQRHRDNKLWPQLEITDGEEQHDEEEDETA